MAPETCAICIDTENDNFEYLPCKHTFHTHCIEQYIDYSISNTKTVTCPLCRYILYEFKDNNNFEIDNTVDSNSDIYIDYSYLTCTQKFLNSDWFVFCLKSVVFSGIITGITLFIVKSS
jgi:hypothetical protein